MIVFAVPAASLKSERVFSVAGNIVTPQEGLTKPCRGGAAHHRKVQHAAAEAIRNPHVDCLTLWTLLWNLNCIDNKIF